MTRDDLKKLFPNSKFPTAEELKAKEGSLSIGDRVKVADNIRCRQKGKIGTIVRIDPEDEHGWKSFIVQFDDKKYGSMGFNSGYLDKISEKINKKAQYEPPWTIDRIRKELGDKVADRLANDPVHKWRSDTGIELVHREPTKKELKRIIANWKFMTDEQKRLSDEKSKELFGVTNEENAEKLLGDYSRPMNPERLNKLYSKLKYRILHKETNRPFFNTNRKAFANWHLLSPEQIKKHKIGICWDTAAMTDSELSRLGIPHENYFSHAEDLNRPTHAFNVYRDENGDWRWIEGSWEKYKDNDWHERRKKDLVRRIVKALESEGFDEETGGNKQILHKIDKFPEAGVNGRQFFNAMLSAPVKKTAEAKPMTTLAGLISFSKQAQLGATKPIAPQVAQRDKMWAGLTDAQRNAFADEVRAAGGANAYAAKASGRAVPPQPRRKINPADFGGSALPPSLTKKPQAAPQRTIDPSLRTFRQPSYARNIHGFTDRTGKRIYHQEKKAGLSGLRKLAARLSKQDIQDVNTFYNTIVLPTKQEFGGIPGKDYDPKYYVKDFPLKTKVMYDNPGDSFGGYVSQDDLRNKAYLSPRFNDDTTRSMFVHELTHLQNRDFPYKWRRYVPFGTLVPHSGASAAEDRKLLQAYRFGREAVGPFYEDKEDITQHYLNEQATTNREYRYALWRQLSSRLGKPATYEEFKKYITEMPQTEILNNLDLLLPNGYMERAHEVARGIQFQDPDYSRKYNELLLDKPPASAYQPIHITSDADIEKLKATDWYRHRPEAFTDKFNSLAMQLDEYNATHPRKQPGLLDRIRRKITGAPPPPPGDILDTFVPEDLLHDYRMKALDDLDVEYGKKLKVRDPEAFRKAWLEVAQNDQPSSTSKAAEVKPQSSSPGVSSVVQLIQPVSTRTYMTPFAYGFIKRASARKFNKAQLLGALYKQAQWNVGQTGTATPGLPNVRQALTSLGAGLRNGLGKLPPNATRIGIDLPGNKVPQSPGINPNQIPRPKPGLATPPFGNRGISDQIRRRLGGLPSTENTPPKTPPKGTPADTPVYPWSRDWEPWKKRHPVTQDPDRIQWMSRS